MTIYYVDAARPDDTGNGQSWGAAKKTIVAGEALLSAGDTLKIKTGSYSDGLEFTGSGTSGNLIRVETDDGAGDPGIVTITGTTTINVWGGGTASINFENYSYLEVDGRQTDGFVCTIPTSASWGAIGYNSSDAGNSVSLKYVRFNGTSLNGGAAENHVVTIYGYDDPEVSYCTFNVAAGTDFILEVGSDGGGGAGANPTGGAQIHHNEFLDGSTASGYSVISILRHDSADVYSNYIHDISSNAAILRSRQGHNNLFYNNVIWIQSGESPDCVFQYRGFSTGTGYADGNEFYNNTVILEGSFGSSALMISDYADDNKVYNNLIIGNVGTFVAGWNYIGASNEIYNNTITGTITDWFENQSCEDTFDVDSNNTSSQGTAFIAESGDKPSPYWDLSASKDGSGSIPSVDYNGDARSNPVDVGAFEYSALASVVPTMMNKRIRNLLTR